MLDCVVKKGSNVPIIEEQLQTNEVSDISKRWRLMFMMFGIKVVFGFV